MGFMQYTSYMDPYGSMFNKMYCCNNFPNRRYPKYVLDILDFENYIFFKVNLYKLS